MKANTWASLPPIGNVSQDFLPVSRDVQLNSTLNTISHGNNEESSESINPVQAFAILHSGVPAAGHACPGHEKDAASRGAKGAFISGNALLQGSHNRQKDKPTLSRAGRAYLAEALGTTAANSDISFSHQAVVDQVNALLGGGTEAGDQTGLAQLLESSDHLDFSDSDMADESGDEAGSSSGTCSETEGQKCSTEHRSNSRKSNRAGTERILPPRRQQSRASEQEFDAGDVTDPELEDGQDYRAYEGDAKVLSVPATAQPSAKALEKAEKWAEAAAANPTFIPTVRIKGAPAIAGAKAAHQFLHFAQAHETRRKLSNTAAFQRFSPATSHSFPQAFSMFLNVAVKQGNMSEEKKKLIEAIMNTGDATPEATSLLASLMSAVQSPANPCNPTNIGTSTAAKNSLAAWQAGLPHATSNPIISSVNVHNSQPTDRPLKRTAIAACNSAVMVQSTAGLVNLVSAFSQPSTSSHKQSNMPTNPTAVTTPHQASNEVGVQSTTNAPGQFDFDADDALMGKHMLLGGDDDDNHSDPILSTLDSVNSFALKDMAMEDLLANLEADIITNNTKMSTSSLGLDPVSTMFDGQLKAGLHAHTSNSIPSQSRRNTQSQGGANSHSWMIDNSDLYRATLPVDEAAQLAATEEKLKAQLESLQRRKQQLQEQQGAGNTSSNKSGSQSLSSSMVSYSKLQSASPHEPAKSTPQLVLGGDPSSSMPIPVASQPWIVPVHSLLGSEDSHYAGSTRSNPTSSTPRILGSSNGIGLNKSHSHTIRSRTSTHHENIMKTMPDISLFNELPGPQTQIRAKTSRSLRSSRSHHAGVERQHEAGANMPAWPGARIQHTDAMPGSIPLPKLATELDQATMEAMLDAFLPIDNDHGADAAGNDDGMDISAKPPPTIGGDRGAAAQDPTASLIVMTNADTDADAVPHRASGTYSQGRAALNGADSSGCSASSGSRGCVHSPGPAGIKLGQGMIQLGNTGSVAAPDIQTAILLAAQQCAARSKANLTANANNGSQLPTLSGPISSSAQYGSNNNIASDGSDTPNNNHRSNGSNSAADYGENLLLNPFNPSNKVVPPSRPTSKPAGGSFDEDSDDNDSMQEDDNPRNKQFVVRAPINSSETRLITLPMLQQVYHLPIKEAADALGIGSTVLKRYCRQFKIIRWPFRKLKSLDKLISSVEEQSCNDPSGTSYVLAELQKFRAELYENPETNFDERIKKLRQANFKQEYKARIAMNSNPTNMLDVDDAMTLAALAVQQAGQ